MESDMRKYQLLRNSIPNEESEQPSSPLWYDLPVLSDHHIPAQSALNTSDSTELQSSHIITEQSLLPRESRIVETITISAALILMITLFLLGESFGWAKLFSWLT